MRWERLGGMARKLGLIALSVVALIVVVAAGAVAWLAWFPDTLKPSLERLLTAQLGQQVRIEGPLRIKPGGVTTIEVNGLHIAAPEWARADEIVAIERLRVAADVWAYLRYGTINIIEFTANSPRIALERDAQARTSWPSGGGSGKSSGIPKISVGTVTISDGRLQFIDAPSEVELAATMATEAASGAAVGLKLDGSGKVRGDPLQFRLHVGELQQLAQSGSPVPVDGNLTLAATRAQLKGVIKQPAALGRHRSEPEARQRRSVWAARARRPQGGWTSPSPCRQRQADRGREGLRTRRSAGALGRE